MMGVDSPFLRGTMDPSQQGLALAGDYHNGPLSVVLPFGIWGVIAFGWFLIAGVRVTYCNFRYGDENLRAFNTFLFSYFVVLTVMFLAVGGSLSSDIARFIGTLGLSICINGGVRRPVPSTEEVSSGGTSPNLLPRPSFQR